jgi:hypothetical protein
MKLSIKFISFYSESNLIQCRNQESEIYPMASIKDKTAATIPKILKTTFKNVITKFLNFYFFGCVFTYIQAGNVITIKTEQVPPKNDRAAITLGKPIAIPAAAA